MCDELCGRISIMCDELCGGVLGFVRQMGTPMYDERTHPKTCDGVEAGIT